MVAVSREEVPEFPGDIVVHDRYDAIRDVVAHFANSGRKRVSIMDAIFCVNDVGALYVMRELQDGGIRIPEDIAIIVLNNAPTGLVCPPPLATLGRMQDDVAHEVFTLLMNRIENPDPEKQIRHVHMKFLPRESAGGVPVENTCQLLLHRHIAEAQLRLPLFAVNGKRWPVVAWDKL